MVDPLDNLTSSEQLRRLLLQEEQERIDRLEARLGDDDSLRNSLIPIIADVLRDAGVKDYRRLADALAPIVLQSIKTEIHNSRDMMVDALYPITGRLVAAAVRNAFKDLVEQLNTKLDSTLSVDRWRTRFKAKMSGQSEAEILLSEGAAFEIVDLLLINRQSGLLIAQAADQADQAGTSSHLLTSILTAIMAFVRDAMSQSSEQDLRTLDVGDIQLHLQVSPGAILAIKTKGPPPTGFETALSETFYAFLSRWGRELGDPGQMESHQTSALTEDLEDRFQVLLKAKQTSFRKRSKKGTILLGTLAATAALWIGWMIYDGWTANRIEAMARSVIDQHRELKGYPVEARYNQTSNSLILSGLLPNQEVENALQDDLRETFPDISLSMNVGSLPDQPIDPATVPSNADLAELRDVLRDEVIDVLDQRLSVWPERLAEYERRLPTAAEAEHAALRSWLGRQSVRFGDASEFLDEVQATEVLRKTADRFSGLSADFGLRVVGYSDDLGGDDVSARVSRSRAAVVADGLNNLGVPSERLQAVGRGNERRLGDSDGIGSVNRRVEFELFYLSDGHTSEGISSEPDDDAR